MDVILGIIAYAGLSALTIGYFIVKRLGDQHDNNQYQEAHETDHIKIRDALMGEKIDRINEVSESD